MLPLIGKMQRENLAALECELGVGLATRFRIGSGKQALPSQTNRVVVWEGSACFPNPLLRELLFQHPSKKELSLHHE